MKVRYVSLVVGLLACGTAAFVPAARAAEPAQAVKPGISAEASAALKQMSKTLLSKEFSFKARTIRVYEDNSGDFLHIFHTINVVVRRPNRLSATAVGDDGTTKLLYDGKTVDLVNVDDNEYAQVPMQGNLQTALEDIASRLHVNFPLADFLTNDPGKAFLSGVTSGREVNTVTIDGTPCRHFYFSQAGGIELELWLSKNAPAVPRRLIVTYRTLPGQPNFIAEFSDWNFAIHPSDSEFVFQPPAGAKQVDLKRAAEAAPGEGGK